MRIHVKVLLTIALSASASAWAEEPENYIKYRQAMMSAIGGHMGAATQIVRGKVNPDGDLAIHAKALADLSTDLPRLFPEGSDFGETKAKPEIWEEWERFERASEDARKATAAFAEAVSAGVDENIGPALKEVGESCKGCHKHFREKDE